MVVLQFYCLTSAVAAGSVHCPGEVMLTTISISKAIGSTWDRRLGADMITNVMALSVRRRQP